MVAWPSSSWIARRSAPPSSRCVANECRRACGCAVRERRGMGCSLARPRAQPPPDVGGAEPAARLREEQPAIGVRDRVPGARERGIARSPAARARRRARSASCRPCPRPVPIPSRNRWTPGPARRAPRPAGRTRTRARTAHGRAAQAASSPGSGQAASRPRRVSALAAAAGASSASSAAPPGSRSRAPSSTWLRNSPRSAASLRAIVDGRLAALREPGGVAAQRAHVDRARARGRRRWPRRRTVELSIAYAWRVLAATARRRRSSSNCSSALRHDGLIVDADGGLVSGALIGALLFAVVARHPACAGAQAM